MTDLTDDPLISALEVLGLNEGANEEDVTLATIEAVHRASALEDTQDMHAGILEAMLAEDTITSYRLNAKMPGALESVGYLPETRIPYFSKLADNVVSAIIAQNGRDILEDLSQQIRDYKALEAGEKLSPSFAERALNKVGVQLPEQIGQTMSRLGSPADSRQVRSNLLRRARLYEGIITQFAMLETMGGPSVDPHARREL